jgi:hypothetical protein
MSSSSQQGGGGGEGSGKSGTKPLQRFDRTGLNAAGPNKLLKQMSLFEAVGRPCHLEVRVPPPTPVTLPPFQQKANKGKESAVDEKTAKANGIHTNLEGIARPPPSRAKANGEEPTSKKARTTKEDIKANDDGENDENDESVRRRRFRRVIDDEAEDADNEDGGGGGGGSGRPDGSSDSFIQLDKDWQRSNLQPDEWEEVKRLEGALARNCAAFEKVMKGIMKIQSLKKSASGAGESSMTDAEVKDKRQELKKMVRKLMEEKDSITRQIKEIKSRADSFIDNGDDDDDEAVVDNGADDDSKSEPEEDTEQALDAKLDGDDDIKMTDAAVSGLLKSGQTSKAANALSMARALASSKKRRANREKQQQSSDEPENLVQGAGAPKRLDGAAGLIRDVQSLREKLWSGRVKDEWDAVRDEIADRVEQATKQNLVDDNFMYCYRYRTPEGVWEVTAHTLTHTQIDDRGRTVPLVEWVHVTVSAPPSKSLCSLIVFSGPLVSLWRTWESMSNLGIGALAAITSGVIANSDARKACRLGLLLMLRVYQLRNPHST